MATTRARPTVRVDRYRVRCDEYTQTFQSEARARAQVARIEQAGACLLLHTVDIQPGSEGPWLPIHVHRAQLILAAPLGAIIDTPNGPLIKAYGGWSAEAAARADSAAEPGSPKWLSLLGTHERASLVSDGRGCIPETWCSCQAGPDSATWVRYERYTAEGRAAHGYLCPTCRRLVQSG